MVHGNTIHYRIQDLLEYAGEVNEVVPLYLCIMIKAARVRMGDKLDPFTNARKLIKDCGEIRLENDALRLPIFKLIKMNNLIANFTTVRYLIEDHPEECMNGNKSDRDRIRGLIGSIDVNASISDSERYIIEQVRAFFDRIAPSYLPGVFNLPYTVEDIRDKIIYVNGSVTDNYALFLPIINKVCHDCHYSLTNAVGLALQFSYCFIGSVWTAVNKPGMEEVKRFLVDGIKTLAIESLQAFYKLVIRPRIKQYIGNTTVMKLMDELMECTKKFLWSNHPYALPCCVAIIIVAIGLGFYFDYNNALRMIVTFLISNNPFDIIVAIGLGFYLRGHLSIEWRN